MKALNALATVALAAYAIFALTACNGTSNGSSASTTCTLNATTGMYVDQNGNSCAGAASVTTCPATGYVTTATGVQACTPGQIVTTGTTGTTVCPATALNPSTGLYCTPGTVLPSTGYPYAGSPTAGSGCTSYYYEYGVQYVPIYYNGQLVCANYNDLIMSMSTSSGNYSSYTTSSYYNDPSYWYTYPPYSQSYSSGAGVYVNAGSSGFSAGFYLNF